jgi:hypothetical protein
MGKVRPHKTTHYGKQTPEKPPTLSIVDDRIDIAIYRWIIRFCLSSGYGSRHSTAGPYASLKKLTAQVEEIVIRGH